MARRHYSQTPEDRRRSGIIFAIFGIIVLIFGVYMEMDYKKIDRLCTRYEIGTVASVDSKQVRSNGRRRHRVVPRSRYHYEYQAHVTFEGGSPLSETTVKSNWTKREYQTGQSVKVFYNPDDPTMYYVEGAAPQRGDVMVIFGAIFATVGVFFFVTASKELKSEW